MDTPQEFSSFDVFLSYVLTHFPNAAVEEDNEGQLLIYVNLQEKSDGSISSYTP